MPIIDGIRSTCLIRSFGSFPHGPQRTQLSLRVQPHGRSPIIAVSASLSERDQPSYVEAGFDGWILKPIDFKRLDDVLTTIVDSDKREGILYGTGKWEHGGWFQDVRGEEIN